MPLSALRRRQDVSRFPEDRHIVVPAALWIETNYSPAVWLQLAIYLPFTFVSSLLLLQPIKGAVVGFQWALRMHGFDENAPDDITPV